MNYGWALSLGSGLLAHVADAALRSLAMACLAAIGLAWARRKDAVLHLVIWRVMLYSALAMPLMAWLMPALPLPLPATFSKQQEQVTPPVSLVQPVERTPAPAVFTTHVETLSRAPVPQIPKRDVPWKAIATAIYLLAAGLFLARLFLGWALSRRLQRRSRRINNPEAVAATIELGRALGLRSVPEMAESNAVAAPVTLGVRRPVVLLPATWHEWEERKLHAVLAHELSHVARHDALTQMLAALHRCIFWFSPLGWWLERQLAQLAEEASDDFALNTVSDRDYYAQILVDFMGAVQSARGRISWQGVSMAKGSRVERRVNRIMFGNSSVLSQLGKPFWVGVLLVTAPLTCLLAAVRPVPRTATQIAVSQGAISPEPADASSGVGLSTPSAGTLTAFAREAQDEPAPPTEPAPAAAPVPAPAPPPAAQPAPPKAPKPPKAFHWANYNDDYEDAESYVIVSGDSISMSGGPADARHAKSLQNKISGDFIWFRHDGKGYVIRDAATVRQAKEFFAPQEALGRQQEELGKKQEALGRKQEELGQQMEQVRIQVPDMSADVRRLQEQLAKLREGATMEQIGEAQSALGELQSRLGQLQGQAGVEQSKLGQMQGELGRQQGQLGAQQGKLGAEQGRLAREAQVKMKALLDQAVKSGAARPE